MKNVITNMTMAMTMNTNMDTNMNMSTNIMRASAWKQLYSTPYVNFDLFLADVIQSIGLLISSLFIFFLGSDKGAPV